MLSVNAPQIGIELAGFGARVRIARRIVRREARQIGRGVRQPDVVKEGIAPVALDRDRVLALVQMHVARGQLLPALAGVEREQDFALRFAVDQQILRFVGLFRIAEALDIADIQRIVAVRRCIDRDGRGGVLAVDVDIAVARPALHVTDIAEAVLVDLLPCDRLTVFAVCQRAAFKLDLDLRARRGSRADRERERTDAQHR